MNATLNRVTLLLDNVSLLPDASFRIGGGDLFNAANVHAMPLGDDPACALSAQQRPLRDALATVFYMAAYARVYQGGPVTAGDFPPPPQADAAFTASLVAANAGLERWDAGWRIYKTDPGGAVHVQKGDTATLARAGQYATGGIGMGPVAGGCAQLLLAHESLLMQPGYYYALGQTVMSDHDLARLSRLYFHLDAGQAAWAVRTLTATMNRYHLPFRLKTPTDPRQYERTDGLVVYVPRRFLPAALRLVLDAQGEWRPRLRAGAPLFACDILPGLSGADDPGNGESFGQTRCRLLADALVTSGASAGATWLAAANARFRVAGLSLERGHLSSGLTDVYAPALAEAA
ncbi:hypothetical protein INH39_27540 [Massilia violaceinigra]|uniref:Uncharacterized protein n=1 Tax=Massilia violaceinigra TaxID=2045208 RepID=A0ABY4A319_9BURK|nr:T3SS effector HopA1 family protein [Massilia violaceinigra]UOD29131.1 hypothetical protein INH39_27540 [Massilia violaceinigra]